MKRVREHFLYSLADFDSCSYLAFTIRLLQKGRHGNGRKRFDDGHELALHRLANIKEKLESAVFRRTSVVCMGLCVLVLIFALRKSTGSAVLPDIERCRFIPFHYHLGWPVLPLPEAVTWPGIAVQHHVRSFS